MKYVINYHTGIKDTIEADDLEEAKEVTEDRMAYTQQNVTIETEEGEVISTSYWYGVLPDGDVDEDDVLFHFGEFGFYHNWQDE